MASSMAASVTGHLSSRGCPNRATPVRRFSGSRARSACFILSTSGSPTAPRATLIRSRAR